MDKSKFVKRTHEICQYIANSDDSELETEALFGAIGGVAHMLELDPKQRALLICKTFDVLTYEQKPRANIEMLTVAVLHIINTATDYKKPKLNEKISMAVSVIGSIYNAMPPAVREDIKDALQQIDDGEMAPNIVH